MKKAILLTLLLHHLPVLAASITPSAIPGNLHVYSESGSVYVDHVAQDCSHSRYILKEDHVRFDAMLSMLMAAQLAGRKVQLRFDGCNFQNQGVVVGVYLK